MGKKDTITKNYMKENRVFADAFNYLLYNGQQMIQPEKLREIDTTEMAILQGGDPVSYTHLRAHETLS